MKRQFNAPRVLRCERERTESSTENCFGNVIYPTNDRIAIDPEIQHGKPVIRGTRVPVTRLLGGLAGGMSFDQLCIEYGVEVEDIRAAIGYAEGLVNRKSHFPLAAH